MEFDGFDWDVGNRVKCQKHGVSIEEIESLFATPLLIGPDPWQSERRLRAFGKAREGRGLLIVFTMRSRDGRRLIRPISARYMHEKEIKKYDEEVSRSA